MIGTAQTRRAAHPPGPKNLFPGQILFAFRRDPLGFLTRLARQWGDIVQFKIAGKTYFLLNHPDFIRDVVVSDAHRFEKGPALRRARVTLGKGLLTSEGELHRRQRRLSQPAFAAHRIETYAAAIVEETARLRQSFRNGQMIDIHEQMMELTLMIAARAFFGVDVQAQVHEIGRAMSISVGMFGRAMMPWGTLLNYLPLPSNFRFKKAQKVLFDTIDGIVRQRRASNQRGDDFLSMLLAARDVEGDGGGMSDQQLRDEAITIFTAGHETTANALTYAWHLLSQHPDVAKKMAAEVDEVLGKRLPSADDAAKLKYTRTVLAEAIRLYPPVWAIGRSTIEPCSIGGFDIRPGTVVLMSQWVMHRDQRFWPDPQKFDPDRWQNAAPDRPRLAYFPFSLGPRGCIGEAFAWLEGVLVLATLAQNWSFYDVDHKPLAFAPTISLRPAHALRMQVHPR